MNYNEFIGDEDWATLLVVLSGHLPNRITITK